MVGAGIAGLAVASGLQRAGWDVSVLERAADSQPAPAGLSIFGNGFRALDELGLGSAVRAISADEPPYTKSGIRKPNGRFLVTFAPTTYQNLRAVDRTELHAAMLATLRAGSVHWGQRVAEAGTDGVHTDDGHHAEADLIVGADGIRSRVRASLPQDRPTRRSGYGVWRAITARPVPVGAGGETWGSGQRFGLVPLKDGRVYWFAVVTSARNETGAAALDEVRSLFGGWHEPIAELIDATEPEAVHYTHSEELDGPLRSYVHGRTVLIGDAAHAMSPNLGQGANQALEDAATLCALLAPVQDRTEIEPALHRYDRLRRPRTQRIARESHNIGIAGQWSNPVLVWCRKTGMTLAPNWVFSRRTTRLQEWQFRSGK
ncbi:FAD-dependent oxidoreductase [Mycobacterium kiyosense]|uniref:FAD-dependent oxidoreductase n=1 Tax=Mycobacterium kiyosense TaxID=2871094 RepID=A0AA37PY55_9MYCO|nr:FAD-dependent oxidoreductase [Mycobacterium sp. 20KCMC460]GLB83708.1 FAD-dependent oxidoreductase [Mycobacterium kiyosense]GLB88770.1 FAD-dependent oxidoreductase [Mycobacterium kiyosense]GLB96371.1 FAD-dependent oxidoreductase [Mycobacterium kiyosense]GLC03378.1 FAD-dependent oxidoreductase [Mycobacterium kiyosense]